MELGSEVRELRPPRKSSVPPPQGTAQVSDAENPGGRTRVRSAWKYFSPFDDI